VNIRFVNQFDLEGMNVFPTIRQLAVQFDPARHAHH
jgi:hypothetical protein